MPAPVPVRAQQPDPGRRRALRWLAGTAVVAMGVGASVVLSGGNLQTLVTGDAMSDSEAQARADAFAAAGALALAEVPAGERSDALRETGLPDAQQAALARDAVSGQVRLVYLTLWDDLYEDGDAVRIASAGFSRDITLRNAPTRLAVPLQGAGGITVTGLHDGTGGITVAIRTGRGKVPLPRMAVGQVITIAVR